MLKIWKNNKFLFIFILALIFVFPTTINMPSVSETRVIVVGLGIDKENDEYTVSTQFIVPKQTSSFAPIYQVVSAKGPTLKEAMDNIGVHLGKKIAMGQCEYICINDEVASENVVNLIDYLHRAKYIPNSTTFVNTNDSCKMLLDLNNKMHTNYSFDLTGLIQYDHEFVSIDNCNVEKIFNAYFSDNNTFVMLNIDVEEEETEGVKADTASQSDSSGGSSGGSSGSSDSSSGGESTESSKTVIANASKLSVFKDSRKVGVITRDDLEGYKWTMNNAHSLRFHIENFTDSLYTDADIGFNVNNLKNSKSVEIVGDKISVKYDIETDVRITDIQQDNKNLTIYWTDTNLLTPALEEAIKSYVTEKINSSFLTFKQFDSDYFEVYNYMRKYHYTEWNQYLNSLAEGESYLNNVEFEINVKVSDSQT